ncbi:MAG: ATP-binding protein [Pyrinomonadaceae bacterium]
MERGGPTTQSGIHYQNSITALYMGDLVDPSDIPRKRKVVAVRVEAPESVDDTVVTYDDGHKLYLQAKENIQQNEAAWEDLWKDLRKQFDGSSFQKDTDRLCITFGSSRDEYHLLEDICNRAIGAVDIAEFHRRLTDKQTNILGRIETILFASDSSRKAPAEETDLSASEPQASDKEKKKKGRKKVAHVASDDERKYLLELFRHISIDIRPPQLVKESIKLRIPTSNRSQEELFARFRDRAGEEARIRGSFNAAGLLSELEGDGILLTKQLTIDELRDIAFRSGAELKNYKYTFGSTGVHVERQITNEIVDWIVSGPAKEQIAALLDSAGAGKTVIARDVLEALESKGVPVLTLKGDLLSGIANLEDLQNRLALPENVERVLMHLASDEPAVLLVDQIDALSLSLAHDLNALDVVLKLIARARLLPNVRIVIACRTFDFKNDPKLSRLEISKEFTISPLSDEEIGDVLKEFGLEFGTLQPSLQALLRTPLHLDLFSRLAAEARGSDEAELLLRLRGLNSLQELYAALWEFVVTKPSPEAPQPAVRGRVLELIVERMDAKQEVSVSRMWLRRQNEADLENAVSWLASQGVIIANKDRWLLLHQTFFDYCYAKGFVESEKSLFENVKAGDQGLFVRSQILQVLNYSRSADPHRYLKDLLQILSDGDIRFHIRDHVMRWFGSVPSPTADEWAVAKNVMKVKVDGTRLRWYMQGNVGWFSYLKDDVVKTLNAGTDEEIDGWAFPMLGSIFGREQGVVSEIVKPFLDRGPLWLKRIDNLFWNVKEWTATAIALYGELLGRSEDKHRREFYRMQPIAGSQPKEAARLIRKALDRELDAAKKRNPKPITWMFRSDLEHLNGSGIGEVLKAVAEKEPCAFLNELVPWLEGVLRDAGISEDFEIYLSDPLSSGLDYGTFVVQTQILEAFQLALVALGRNDRDKFLEIAKKFADLPFETSQRLLARAFTELGEMYHHEAKQFLAGDRRRLVLGSSEVFESRQLVKVITPFLEESDANELEAAIFSLLKGKIGNLQHLRFRFRNQLFLLDSFQADKLTPAGSAYRAELWRKFPGMTISERPLASMSGFVGSPITQESIDKMSDGSWLSAFRKYSKGVSHTEFLKGGAEQLSAVLVREVTADPDRFYRLACSLPDDVDSPYLAAFITGLAKSESHDDELFDVLRRFDAIDDDRLANVSASALRERSSDVPDDILEALERRLHGPASEDEEGWRTRPNVSGRSFSPLNDSAFISLLNSTRGAVFQAVMVILDARGDRERKWSHLVELASTGSDALRSGVIQHLLSFYSEKKDDCVDLFEAMIGKSAELLETHFALEFIYWATPFHFDRLSRFIVVTMESRHESVQHRAGNLACLAPLYDQIAAHAILSNAAEKLAVLARTHPSKDVRSGAAEVYVTNLKTGSLRATCVRNLSQMLGDKEQPVIEQIAWIFTRWTDNDISEIKDLISLFVDAGIPLDEEREFGEFLWRIGMNDSDWAISLIAKSVEQNPITEGYRDGEYFIRFVLGVYISPLVPSGTKERALDLFDLLSLRYSGSASRVLSEWDRY